MGKVALLVDFNPRTRVVVDVPDGMTVKEWLEKDENFESLANKARKKMLLEKIEDYLSSENMYWTNDMECPYGSLPMDNKE